MHEALPVTPHHQELTSIAKARYFGVIALGGLNIFIFRMHLRHIIALIVVTCLEQDQEAAGLRCAIISTSCIIQQHITAANLVYCHDSILSVLISTICICLLCLSLE